MFSIIRTKVISILSNSSHAKRKLNQAETFATAKAVETKLFITKTCLNDYITINYLYEVHIPTHYIKRIEINVLLVMALQWQVC